MEDLSQLRYKIIESKMFYDDISLLFGKNVDIRYSNFGLIVIPENKSYIIKVYYNNLFFQSFGFHDSKNFFQSEKLNYDLFKGKGIYCPEFIDAGKIKLGNYLFDSAQITNIRRKSIKPESFLDVNPIHLANILSTIHSIKPNFIHGNIHSSNFFIYDGKLGIFDLVDCRIGNYEQDIARIIIDIEGDFKYMNQFLGAYQHKIKLDYVLDLAISHLEYIIEYAQNNIKRSERILEVLRYQKEQNNSNKLFTEFDSLDIIKKSEQIEILNEDEIMSQMREIQMLSKDNKPDLETMKIKYLELQKIYPYHKGIQIGLEKIMNNKY